MIKADFFLFLVRVKSLYPDKTLFESLGSHCKKKTNYFVVEMFTYINILFGCYHNFLTPSVKCFAS